MGCFDLSTFALAAATRILRRARLVGGCRVSNWHNHRPPAPNFGGAATSEKKKKRKKKKKKEKKKKKKKKKTKQKNQSAGIRGQDLEVKV